MADSAPGEEGFHPLSARKVGTGFSEVLPLHQPIVTIAEPFDRALMLRTPMMEEPQKSPSMPVLTPQPQDGISSAKLTPKSSSQPTTTGNFSNVSSTETAKECIFMFGCQDISVMTEKKEKKIFTETGSVKLLFGLYVKNLCQGIYHM